MMHIGKEEFRARFSKFVGEMEPDEIDAFMATMGEVQLSKGDTLLTYGQASDTLFLIWEGKLSIELEVDGTSTRLAEVSSGQGIGEISMIEPGPASATVKAAEDSTLFTHTHKDFRTFSQGHPQAAAALLRVVTKNIAVRMRASTTTSIKYDANGKLMLEQSAEQEKSRLLRLLTHLIGHREGE